MIEQIEIWKSVVGFEGLYEVSNLGRVRNIPKAWKCGWRSSQLVQHKQRILKPTISHGYETVFLRNDSKYFHTGIHRLIAEAFIPNTENKPHVNHINGNRSDNRIENLEWVTMNENMWHAFNMGLCDGFIGSKHHSSKLTKEDVFEIKGIYKKGLISYYELGKLFNVSANAVSLIIRGKNWRIASTRQ